MMSAAVRRTLTRAAALCGLTAALLGCGAQVPGAPGSPSSATPSAGGTSSAGIEGHTVVGPECPVQRADSPCPDRPLRARLTVIAAGSPVPLETADSDATGYFRIALAPGRYTVRSANLTGAVYPAAQPITVTVVAGRFTTVTVSFDSGIR